MIKFNEEIMRKVEEKEKRNSYVRRCVAVSICPECGENLTSKVPDYDAILFDCTSCKFRYTEWLPRSKS